MAITTVSVKGVEFIIEFDYSPACKGSRGSHGEPMEPDSAAEVELCAVRQSGADDDTDILCWIDEALNDLLCDALLEYSASAAQDARDDAAIERYRDRIAA